MTTAATMLVPITLFTVMLALGMGLPTNGWRDWRRHWPLFLRVEMLTCLVIPLAIWLLLCVPAAHRLGAEARHAIALMALCPSAPLIVRKAGKSGGDAALAAQLQIAAALIAIVTVPLLAQVGQHLFGVHGWDILPRHVALQVAQIQLLPLLLGLTLRRRAPALSERLQAPLDRVANLLLVLLVIAVLLKAAPLLLSFAKANGLALVVMALSVTGSLLLGWVAAGPQVEQRATVALVTSMRNPGLALLLSNRHAPQLGEVKLGILLYVLVTVVLSIPVLHWQQRCNESR